MTIQVNPGTSTPAQPGDPILPGDRLEEIDTTLYHFEHMCALIGAFAGQPSATFTDGLPLEMYAVVFDWIRDELHDVRLGLEEVRKWVFSSPEGL